MRKLTAGGALSNDGSPSSSFAHFILVASGVDADGVAALMAIQNKRPAIALLDFVMPKLNGIEFPEILKAQEIETRVVLLTAHAKKADKTAALERGAYGILGKDVACGTLMECLNAVAAGQKWFPDDAADGHQWPEMRVLAGLDLTPRELQVASLIAGGMSNKDIARQLGVVEGTIKLHLHNIYAKAGLANRTELAGWAIRSKGPRKIEK